MTDNKTPENSATRAVRKYHEANFKWMSIGLHRTTDADIIQGLEGTKNRSAFIKEAIRDALRRS